MEDVNKPVRELIRPDECPYYLISRATLVATSALKKGFRDAGLEFVKPSYLGILLSLWKTDGLKPVELCKRAGLEASSMTGLLDRMEKAELLGRSADPNDRRAQIILLTKRGNEVRDRVIAIANKTVAEVFEGVAEEDVGALKSTLRTVLSNANRMEAGDV